MATIIRGCKFPTHKIVLEGLPVNRADNEGKPNPVMEIQSTPEGMVVVKMTDSGAFPPKLLIRWLAAIIPQQ